MDLKFGNMAHTLRRLGLSLNRNLYIFTLSVTLIGCNATKTRVFNDSRRNVYGNKIANQILRVKEINTLLHQYFGKKVCVISKVTDADLSFTLYSNKLDLIDTSNELNINSCFTPNVVLFVQKKSKNIWFTHIYGTDGSNFLLDSYPQKDNTRYILAKVNLGDNQKINSVEYTTMVSEY